MIEKIRIKNYRKFRDLTLPLNADLNVVVGDNDSGKSTILEAINLALSFKINGRFAGTELNSFLFHQPAHFGARRVGDVERPGEIYRAIRRWVIP